MFTFNKLFSLCCKYTQKIFDVAEVSQVGLLRDSSFDALYARMSFVFIVHGVNALCGDCLELAKLLKTFVLGKAEADTELNCLYLIATKIKKSHIRP